MTHPFHKHREHQVSRSRAKRILKADGGEIKPAAKLTVATPSFMMNYDKNAGGQKMRSDMNQAQRISDAVRRNAPKEDF